MNVATVFQFSIYSLTALSGLMLALGEESSFPSGLTPLLCLAAMVFNERLRLVRLSLLWSNALGVAALGLTLFEFFGEQADARLLAGAHFLVYLIWIVLFQDKRAQQYWWLFALGLLQVAVGTVMTLSGWYGLLMLVYLFLALWTMSVFHLYQGAIDFGSTHRRGVAVADATMSAPATMRNVFSAKTTVENAVQQDVPDRWINSRFVFGVTGLSLSGLTLGMVMFLVVPRVWLGRGNIFATQVQSIARAVTGFSSEVRLGHMGRILESAELVLEVRLFDDSNPARRVTLEELSGRQGLPEPLFRGSVFDVYEAGRWSSRDLQALAPMTTRSRSFRERRSETIRQEYVLYPQGTNVLFALRPISAGRLKPSSAIEINTHTLAMSHRSEVRDRLEYVIYSRPFVPSEADRASSGGGPLARLFNDLPIVAELRQDYLELPATRLESLKTLAAAWTAPEKLLGSPLMSDERRRALTIESRLRDSGEFQYSLNMEIRDPARDPVEDFLFNRKNGHCEYFASCLALMLRAVGIPARLVTGFKGAEPVNGGEYYEVQQRHAHAWVEAFFDGAWIALDATPADREESVRRFGTNSEFWKNATSSLSSLWSNYVISMSPNRQKEALYDPLTGTVSGGFSSLREMLDSIKNAALWLKEQFTSPEQLLSGAGASLLLGVVVGLGLVTALGRRLSGWLAHRSAVDLRSSVFARWFGRLRWRWGNAPGSQAIVDFYETFLRLVSARGLRPEVHQTQREFADHVGQVLGESLRHDGLATLPHDVADLYYRVRFGGANLPAPEIVDLEERMRRLAVALRPTTGVRRKAGGRPV